MEIKQADIICSAAGHDKGDLFVVVGVEERFFLLTDGNNRPLNRPKRKNKKHVRFMGKSDHPVLARLAAGEHVENREIRKVLAIRKTQDLREANTLGQR